MRSPGERQQQRHEKPDRPAGQHQRPADHEEDQGAQRGALWIVPIRSFLRLVGPRTLALVKISVITLTETDQVGSGTGG
jgi:hypothetical protein